MRNRVNLEVLISILVLSIFNGLVLSKVIVPRFEVTLLSFILTGMLFGLLYYFLFLWIYTKHNMLKRVNNIKEQKIDKLTGLFNKRAFEVNMKNIDSCEVYSAIVIDIDDFKYFNNEYGQAIGNLVLIDVGKIIKQGIRKDDKAYRYGGEEFLIILKDCDKEHAYIIAEKIRNNINSMDYSPFSRITISLGISGPVDGKNVEEVIQSCDKALLFAKKSGKNKTVMFDKNLDF